MSKGLRGLLAAWILMLLLLLASVASAEPLNIMATNFPCFDIARAIVGDTAQVHMLLPPGGESHSYEPTPQDIIAIQSADLFVYVGGESDTWVDGILQSLGVDAPAVFRLSDSVTLLSEAHSHSMEHEDEYEGEEMDEHVWTSPKNVMQMAQDLAQTLTALAPENEQAYQQALHEYLAHLHALDDAFTQTVANGKRRVILFGDRFPFRYFAAAYGLAYDAAFPGCSEDSEPSVRTVLSLVERVQKEHIPVVFYIEFSSRRTADILVEETGAKALLFHSCHNVSAEEIESGATYLSLMWQNVEALKEALG